ncbi:MAG: TldD/PmbA family protein, partial [Candidatus Aenigmarchaeota archaeon]|nr:TldD/PmbA family protein [Candidatus Aenigmarchaeota archaeon]
MIQDLMQRIVDILGDTYYGDVRYESSQSTGIGKNKSEESISTGSSNGLCIRVISDNKWHYLGFDTLDKEKILEEVKRLVMRVGNKPSKLWMQDSWELDKEVPVKEKPDSIPVEERMQTIRQIFSQAMTDKRIVNANIGMGNARSETIFMNTEGSNLRQVLPFFKFVMSVTSKQGKKMENDYFVLAKQGGYELLRGINAEDELNKIVKNSIAMLDAKQIKGGRYDIIIDPEISGVVAHESFGHGLEADQVMRDRSYLASLNGKKIISDLVSMHDNGALPKERGSFLFDDEGIKTRDNTLVDKGVLKKFMHDRQSCMLMNSEPTGNARAQDFSRKVFVRMTNTYVSPGEWKFKELIEDTSSGYYLIKNLTGMEDPLGGNMQMVIHSAMQIKDGELSGLFKGVTISGKVLEFLNNVDAVTDDFDIRGGG